MKFKSMPGTLFIIQFISLAFFLTILVDPSHALEVGDEVPSFKIKTVDGKSFEMDKLRGKSSLFLVFWATWCPVCKEEIPKVKSLYLSFNPKGMEFLAINVGINDSEKKVIKYKKKYGLDYPTAFDAGSVVTKSFGVMGTPTIIIVDRQGVVRYKGGAVPDNLGDHFEQLME